MNPDDELDAFSARFLSELDGASSAADPVDSANLLRGACVLSIFLLSFAKRGTTTTF